MTNDRMKNRPSGKNQGEGDRESAARYNKAARNFVKSGRVGKALERARGQDAQEARDSEREGRRRAREEDPALYRNYKQPEK
jgi:hypothetical protein